MCIGYDRDDIVFDVISRLSCWYSKADDFFIVLVVLSQAVLVMLYGKLSYSTSDFCSLDRSLICSYFVDISMDEHVFLCDVLNVLFSFIFFSLLDYKMFCCIITHGAGHVFGVLV